jgi:predicted metal-dependent hydrolase
MARLRGDAQRIAAHFGLSYREISPERAQVKRRYGVCYADGRIAVRLKHVTTGKALKYSSLINTVCHELAHLRHFNHGPRFKAFYFNILDYARREGIYRPGAAPRRKWTQMELFSWEPVPSSGIARQSRE